MWAVIPIKNLNETKHRLKSVLNPQERRFFFVAMFEDVLTTLLAVPELEQVAVATVCPTAAKIAENYGASVLSTEKDEGQTAAVARAAEILEAKGVSKMLILPGDVPLVTVEEIQAVIAAHESACSTPDVPAMTIVPARDEQGSNCIVLSPPTAAPLRFGPNSYFPHLEMAQKLELSLNTPKLFGIGLDIDTPEDLLELCRQPSSDVSTKQTQVQKYLQKQKILERLNNV